MGGGYWFASRWKLIYHRYVQITVQGHCKRSWYRSCRHNQYMRRLGVFFPHTGPLRYSKPMLLINNDQTQVFEQDFIFQQGMCPDQDMKFPALQFPMQNFPVFL